MSEQESVRLAKIEILNEMIVEQESVIKKLKKTIASIERSIQSQEKMLLSLEAKKGE